MANTSVISRAPRWLARLTTAGALALLLAGCGHWVISFVPHSASQLRNQIAARAVRFYEGDFSTLEEAGGTYCGVMTVRVERASLDSIQQAHDQVPGEAAEVGATHWFHLSSSTAHSSTTTATKAFGVVVATTRETEELKGARYMLVRVPQQNWQDLPVALRPSGKK